MPRFKAVAPASRWWWVGPVVLLALLAGIGVVSSRSGDDSTNAQEEQQRTTAEGERPPEPLPPEPEPPFRVDDDAPLTLPEEVRLAPGAFYLRGGETYVVSFDLTTVKPEDAPGIGMYLGVSFSCSEQDGRGVGSIGGTENLQPGDPVSYINHIVIEPREDGVYTCGVLARAPYDHVAAKGTTVELDATWRVTETAGTVAEAESGQRLPMTVDPDGSAVAIEQGTAAESDTDVTALATVHMTTCTGVNGSREQGRAWCSKPVIDERGNSATFRLLIDLVDEEGKVCDRLVDDRQDVTIDKWIHHDMLSVESATRTPKSPCSTTARARVYLENDGPAGLVIHESNTSLIVISGDD